MAVVRSVAFDSAVVETYTFDGDELGVRGIELMLGQNNGSRFAIRATNGASNAVYCAGQQSSTGLFPALHVGLPILGNPIQVVFSDAVTHRGRIVLHDEPVGPFGQWPLFDNSVSVPALTSGAGVMANKTAGRCSRMTIIMQTTRQSSVDANVSIGSQIFVIAPLFSFPGATGGFASVAFDVVPDELELLGNNLDAANACTFKFGVQCVF